MTSPRHLQTQLTSVLHMRFNAELVQLLQHMHASDFELVSLSVLSKNAVGLELQNPNSLAEMGTDDIKHAEDNCICSCRI